MNNTNRSNVTSFSFTVEDDLISHTSANTTFVQPKSFGKKPFSIDYHTVSFYFLTAKFLAMQYSYGDGT